MANRIDEVKVFSVTKRKDRDALGERITTWVEARPDLRILSAIVMLSSDRQFHCLSIVLLCAQAAGLVND